MPYTYVLRGGRDPHSGASPLQRVRSRGAMHPLSPTAAGAPTRRAAESARRMFSRGKSGRCPAPAVFPRTSARRVKLAPYECGIEPETDARDRYSIRFYLVAMLFVIFDVETVFMFPWAVMMDELALFGLIEMIVFLFILVVGYVYAWRKGALDWV